MQKRLTISFVVFCVLSIALIATMIWFTFQNIQGGKPVVSVCEQPLVQSEQPSAYAQVPTPSACERQSVNAETEANTGYELILAEWTSPPEWVGKENVCRKSRLYKIYKVNGQEVWELLREIEEPNHQFNEEGVCVHCGYTLPQAT